MNRLIFKAIFKLLRENCVEPKSQWWGKKNFAELLKQMIQSCVLISSLLLLTKVVVMTHRRRSKRSYSEWGPDSDVINYHLWNNFCIMTENVLTLTLYTCVCSFLFFHCLVCQIKNIQFVNCVAWSWEGRFTTDLWISFLFLCKGNATIEQNIQYNWIR